jgi:hypothetical protein
LLISHREQSQSLTGSLTPQPEVLPQLSKSHTSLTSRNSFLRGCVTVAKFISSDYRYVRLYENRTIPTVPNLGPRLARRSGASRGGGGGNHNTCSLFIEPNPSNRDKFDGSAQCKQEGHSLYEKNPEAETASSYNVITGCAKNIRVDRCVLHRPFVRKLLCVIALRGLTLMHY